MKSAESVDNIVRAYGLDGLCRKAGYISVPEAKGREYSTADRMTRIATGIILDDKRFGMGKWRSVFLRELPPEGVEIFHFQDRLRWFQETQESREGLVYFCLPNKARFDHEERFTRECTTNIADIEAEIPEEKRVRLRNYMEAWLNIDRMWPDKWGQMALEILLAEADVGCRENKCLL